MKTVLLFLATVISSLAQTRSLDEVAPHFPTNAPIVWKASMQAVPRRLWVYRWSPETFSPAVVSNAFVIGDFDLKRIPKTWDKDTVIWDGGEPDPRPDYLGITPRFAQLSCTRHRRSVGSGDVNPAALKTRAFDYARRLGVDRNLITTNGSGTNLVSFVRLIDGFPVWDAAEGFEVEFGGHGELLSFSLRWPRIEPHQFAETVTPEQIVECMRKFKTVVMPTPDESTYFERNSRYRAAKSVTITNVAVYYLEGRFGEQPANQDHPEFVTPIVKLKVAVELQTTNETVEMAAPILLSDVERLLGKPSHRQHP